LHPTLAGQSESVQQAEQVVLPEHIFVPAPQAVVQSPAALHDATSPPGAGQAPVPHECAQPVDGLFGASAVHVAPQAWNPEAHWAQVGPAVPGGHVMPESARGGAASAPASGVGPDPVSGLASVPFDASVDASPPCEPSPIPITVASGEPVASLAAPSCRTVTSSPASAALTSEPSSEISAAPCAQEARTSEAPSGARMAAEHLAN
jgi:hypothetical protein